MLEDGLGKVIQGDTTFDEIIKLIDLDDDLGSDTQLGLQNQLEEAQINDDNEKKEEVKAEEVKNEEVKETKEETTEEPKVEETKEETTEEPKVEEIKEEPKQEVTKEVVDESPVGAPTQEPTPSDITDAANTKEDFSFLNNNPIFSNINFQ